MVGISLRTIARLPLLDPATNNKPVKTGNKAINVWRF